MYSLLSRLSLSLPTTAELELLEEESLEAPSELLEATPLTATSLTAPSELPLELRELTEDGPRQIVTRGPLNRPDNFFISPAPSRCCTYYLTVVHDTHYTTYYYTYFLRGPTPYTASLPTVIVL